MRGKVNKAGIMLGIYYKLLHQYVGRQNILKVWEKSHIH